MPRQQRTSRARGQLQPANIRPAADLLWSLTGAVGAVVTAEIQRAPGELRLAGLPAWVCAETAESALSTTLAGAVLSITFPSAPPADFHVSLPPFDPACRSAFGHFLAGGEQHFVPVAEPPRDGFTRTSASGPLTAAVTVNIQSGALTFTLPDAPPDASWWQVGADGTGSFATTVNEFGGSLVQAVGPGELWFFVAIGGVWTPTQVVYPAPPQLPLFALVFGGGPIAAIFTDVSSLSDHTLTLPAGPANLDCYTIQNEGLGGTVTVNDDGGGFVATLLPGQLAWCLFNAGAWGANIRNP